MKKILIALFLLSSLVAKSQNNDKINYKATSIELILTENNKVIAKKPYGRNVEIVYDKFFKSYYITFYNEKSEYGYFKLFYISELNDGNGSVKMRTEDNSIMYVVDHLKTEGVMMIMAEKEVDGATGYYMIHNIVQN